MRFFRSEFAQNYGSYSFGYTEYAVREHNQRHELLELGYLPYTGLPQIQPNTYYLARSLRVCTSPFTVSSENRRVFRKFEAFPIAVTLNPIALYDWTPARKQLCLDYANARFSTNFSQERLNQILSHDHGNLILEVRYQNEIAGIIILGADEAAWHYWFAFFSLELFTDLPFGKWAMTRTLAIAEEQKIPYVYLGTCYGRHSLYKVRDFKGLEYFDGNRWSNDIKSLKSLCKKDETIEQNDLIKTEHHIYTYLQ